MRGFLGSQLKSFILVSPLFQTTNSMPPLHKKNYFMVRTKTREKGVDKKGGVLDLKQQNFKKGTIKVNIRTVQPDKKLPAGDDFGQEGLGHLLINEVKIFYLFIYLIIRGPPQWLHADHVLVKTCPMVPVPYYFSG